MRRTLLWLWLCGCGLDVREPSPAAVPFRPILAPELPGSPVDPAVFAAAVRAGVRQRSANEAVFEVDSFLAALTVLDLRSGRPSVTMRPVVTGGLQTGYSVAGVREGSVYAAIGLLDGDVIEAINGGPLDAPERALDALAGSERGAVLQVQRAGVSAAIELRIGGAVGWAQVLAQRGGAAAADGSAPGAAVAAVAAGAPVPVLEDRSFAAGDAAALDGPAASDEASPGLAGRGGAGAGHGGSGGRGRSGAGQGGGSGAGQGGASPGGGAGTRPGAPSGGGAAVGVQCAADGSCSVARREFDAMVADPDRLARQVQVSPTRGGYRLSGIRGGSDVSKLGFRNGDVLRAVNGTQLDDDFGLIGLYTGLASTRTYNVTYERGGARHTRTIRIRE